MTAKEVDRSQTASSRWLVLAVMCVGYFLVLLDVTVINVALPRSAPVSGRCPRAAVGRRRLRAGAGRAAAGRRPDRRPAGHKRVVLIGMAVFGAGLAACGLAPTVGALIAARVAQGMGAALLLPGTLAIITHAFPDRGEQARAIGIWAGVGSIALAAGPLLGGSGHRHRLAVGVLHQRPDRCHRRRGRRPRGAREPGSPGTPPGPPRGARSPD